MLWLVTSSAVPSSAQRRSSPTRTRSATSGSSDAVGSSSTSRRGRCSVALMMPTRVRCPDDSSLPIALARSVDREALEPDAAPGGRGSAMPYRRPEQREELLDPEALGQRQVAGREADLLHRGAALAREPVADDLDVAGVGGDHAEQHHQRRRLARRRSGPRSATRSPASTSRSMPSTARTRLYCFTRARAVRIGDADDMPAVSQTGAVGARRIGAGRYSSRARRRAYASARRGS